MKKMMMTMLLALTVIAAAAQEKKENKFNEKQFDAKVSELVYRLDMTDEQKTKFVPIYRRYNDEMRALWGGRKRPDKPLTEEEKMARTKQRMERQQQAQSIRLKYMDEFAKVLTAKQVNKFYEVEGRMQKKFMERKHMKQKEFKKKHGDKKMKADCDRREFKQREKED